MSDETTGTDMDDQVERQDPREDAAETQPSDEAPVAETADAVASGADPEASSRSEAGERNSPADETARSATPQDASPAAEGAPQDEADSARLGVGPEVELDDGELESAKAELAPSGKASSETSEDQPISSPGVDQEATTALGGFEPVQPGTNLSVDELGLDEEESAAGDFTDHAVMEILSDCIHMASQPPPPVSTEDSADADGNEQVASAGIALPPPPGTPRIDTLDDDEDEDEDDADALARYGVSSSSAPVTLSRGSKGGPRVDIVPSTTEATGPGWPTVVVGTVAASVLTLALVWGALSSGLLTPPGDDQQPASESAAAPEPAEDEPPSDEPSSDDQAAAPSQGMIGEPASRPPADTEPPGATEPEPSQPQSTEEPQPSGTAGPFNRNAAAEALTKATNRAERCSYPSEPQSGRVSVTIANDGRATKVYVMPGPIAGTTAAWCIAQVFRAIKVAPFEGEPVTLIRRITLNPLPKAKGRAQTHKAASTPDTAAHLPGAL